MKKRILFLSLCIFMACAEVHAQAFSDPTLSFSRLNSIPLKSLSGKKVFIKEKKVSLYLFILLSPECPLCKNYSPAINALKAKYTSDLQVYGLVPGRAYKQKELEEFAYAYQISFPLLIDSNKEFSEYLKATVTPEVVLTDSAGRVVYRGAIDDWVQELGKKKLKPQQFYLEAAIKQYLQGLPVAVKKTIPIGCLINEF